MAMMMLLLLLLLMMTINGQSRTEEIAKLSIPSSYFSPFPLPKI